MTCVGIQCHPEGFVNHVDVFPHLYFWLLMALCMLAVFGIMVLFTSSLPDPEEKYKGTGYKVLTDSSSEGLQSIVNGFLNHGWQLSGSLSVASDFFGHKSYAQAIVKDEPATGSAPINHAEDQP